MVSLMLKPAVSWDTCVKVFSQALRGMWSTVWLKKYQYVRIGRDLISHFLAHKTESEMSSGYVVISPDGPSRRLLSVFHRQRQVFVKTVCLESVGGLCCLPRYFVDFLPWSSMTGVLFCRMSLWVCYGPGYKEPGLLPILNIFIWSICDPRRFNTILQSRNTPISD